MLSRLLDSVLWLHCRGLPECWKACDGCILALRKKEVASCLGRLAAMQDMQDVCGIRCLWKDHNKQLESIVILFHGTE